MVWKAFKTRLRASPLTRASYRLAADAYHGARYLARDALGARAHPAAEFERLFARSADPWGYLGDDVSAERKRLVLEMAGESAPQRMLEIGCAAGWLTADLAPLAREVLAIDISANALERARRRCEGIPNVSFARKDVLEDTLPGRYDAVVCCGVLVYLPRYAQAAIRERIVAALLPGGRLLLEHTRDRAPGHQAGTGIHALYASDPRLELLRRERRDIYEVVLLARR